MSKSNPNPNNKIPEPSYQLPPYLKQRRAGRLASLALEIADVMIRGNKNESGNGFKPTRSSCAHVGKGRYDFWIFDPSECPGPRRRLPQCGPASPLILDLDGDGVEADGSTYFDHEGDGWHELSRWAGKDDGVLVWDRNADGIINDGSELFGNNTKLSNGKTAEHGFAALAELDSNSDGVVNSSDANWSDLRVMQRVSADGESEEALVTLESLGITSLNTGFSESDYVDESGNEHRQVSSYSRTVDGKSVTRTMSDVWLVVDNSSTLYDASLIPEHSAEITALPDSEAYGRVYELRDAMALDDATDDDGNSLLTAPYYSNARTETRSLREMVEDFVATDSEGNPVLDQSARETLAEKILLRWTGAEGAVSGDYGANYLFSHTTPTKLAVVEAFDGIQWREGESYRHPAYSTAQSIEKSYLYHFEKLYAQLMNESHLSDLHAAAKLTLNEGAEADSTDATDYSLDFSGIEAILVNEGNVRKSEWLRSLAAQYGHNSSLLEVMQATAPSWIYEYTYHAEYFEYAVLADGTYGNRDHYSDFIGDNSINVFQTADGTDDMLRGRGGDDIYHLNYGTGHDTIQEFHENAGGDDGDIIKIKEGIGLSSVNLVRSSNREDLIIQLLDKNGIVTDSLLIDNYYTEDSAKIESIVFADGTTWDATDLSLVEITGGEGDDTLYGLSRTNDVFDSDAGGNDVLRGKGGDDTYWLGIGTGHDTIQEFYQNAGSDSGDSIRIKEGIGLSSVNLVRSINREDLVVQILDSDGVVTDSLRVAKHFTEDSAKIESIVFADGTIWDTNDPLLKITVEEITGGTGDDTLSGLSKTNDVFDSDAGGNDILRGRGGNDIYWLGIGTGHDRIEEASDNSAKGDIGDSIRLKEGIAPSSVNLVRSNRGNDLTVQLLDSGGTVTDSLLVANHYSDDSAKIESIVFADGTTWDATDLSLVEITGGRRDEILSGLSATNDVFDSDAGGNDVLRGKGGDDTYWLGMGTGHDSIEEAYSYYGSRRKGDSGDSIRIKEGIGLSSVNLVRSKNGTDLIVQILGSDGVVTDSLLVVDHYRHDSAKVENIVFADGTTWDTNAPLLKITVEEITGGKRDDTLYGTEVNDVFDSDAGGNDILRGRGGDDTYWLGIGTGYDTIDEGHYNTEGDSGDIIRIKEGIAPSSVNLVRSNRGRDLTVQLLDRDGTVTDSLYIANYYIYDNVKIESIVFADGTTWDATEFSVVNLIGGAGNDNLYGLSGFNDIFDSDAGGNDILRGRGGDDTYWLGIGTGYDTIDEGHYNTEGDSGDIIRLKEGIAPSSVNLYRSNRGRDLTVQLLDRDGTVTDSLYIANYYIYDNVKIESIVFADGTTWDATEFSVVNLIGGAGNDNLYGLSGFNDIFDSDAGGNDILRGRGGDDTYWLGIGTGHDTIDEGHYNVEGDSGDSIRLKAGIGLSSVRLLRSNSGDDLTVQILNSDGVVTDSLRVDDHYTDDSAKIESIEVGDQVLLENQYQSLISEIASFKAGTSSFASVGAINEHYWADKESIANPS